jgi:hypothetical protein
LGAIFASSLITVDVRKPKSTNKRKAEGYASPGAVIGHYISFLKIALDEMSK